jgi:hypothetical protein
MARYSTFRASDADREAVADRLRQASVEGRLEPHELEERLAAAFRARTYGDLDPLLRDLPGAKPATRRRATVDVAPVVRLGFVVALRVAVVLAIVTAVVVALALTATWWVLAMIVWFALRASRGAAYGRRHVRHAGWHRPPSARRV